MDTVLLQCLVEGNIFAGGADVKRALGKIAQHETKAPAIYVRSLIDRTGN